MKRSLKDELTKLHINNHKVELISKNELNILINGPKDSFYKNGKFKILITIPDEYPFKSPSIGFITKIFHPNVDEYSGSICLDVLNQVWSPLYDILNVVEVFIPQLLLYPNALDPLNANAANLFLNDKIEFQNKVDEFIKRDVENEKAKYRFNNGSDSDLSI